MLERLAEDSTLPWESISSGGVKVPRPNSVLLVGSGEVEVHAQAGLLEFREAPAMVLDAYQVRARTPVRIAEVTVRTLAASLESHEALELLRGEAGRLERWRHDQLRRDDDFFADAQGGLVPGPYRFGPYSALSILMRGETRHTLPAGLRPIPGLDGYSMLVFSSVERCRALHASSDGRDHGYREIAAFVPCLGPRLVPGLYLPEVFPDAYLPILFGREVYGFAKRMGRVLEHPDGFDLIAGGSHRLRVRTGPAERRNEAFERVLGLYARWGRWARPRLYLRKRILDVEAGPRARNRVDELVSLPFSVFHARPVGVMRSVEVEFPDGRWSLHGTALGALRLELGFTFADGKVVRRRSRWRRR